jgi:hypothetical protein
MAMKRSASSRNGRTAMASVEGIRRFHARGKRLYQRLKGALAPRHTGDIVAIEPDSGQYIIGKDELQVALKAMKRFPTKKFSFFRVGYPAVHKLRSRACCTAASPALGSRSFPFS